MIVNVSYMKYSNNDIIEVDVSLDVFTKQHQRIYRLTVNFINDEGFYPCVKRAYASNISYYMCGDDIHMACDDTVIKIERIGITNAANIAKYLSDTVEHGLTMSSSN